MRAADGQLFSGFKADAGIMTEPTANRIAPICHGILWARIILDGIWRHNITASTGPLLSQLFGVNSA